VRTVVVKTNQFHSGLIAVSLRERLRATGRLVGLVGRAGYSPVDFAAKLEGEASEAYGRWFEAERRLWREADVVVSTTAAFFKAAGGRHGRRSGPSVVIPNYIDEDLVRGTGEKRSSCRVLFAGRLEHQKRVDLLIRAVGLLPGPLRGGCELSIVGEGSLEPALGRLASSLGVRAMFERRCPHAELMGRMRRCGVYAQVSDFEGHPKTVIEAMACGAPVLVREAPGLSDPVTHEQTGLVSSGDPRAIAAGLARLMTDRALADGLGASAAALVRSRFGLACVVRDEVEAHRLALDCAERAQGLPAIEIVEPPASPARYPLA